MNTWVSLLIREYFLLRWLSPAPAVSDVWLVRTTDVDSKAAITANLAICHSDTFYETNYTLIHKLIRYSDSFPPGWCWGCVPAPPLLSQATNSQPVETGSDWEIPSRFSFQPMAPRKVWTGVTPTLLSNWLWFWRRLPSCTRLACEPVILFQFAQAPTRLLRPEKKRGQTPIQNGLVHDYAYHYIELVSSHCLSPSTRVKLHITSIILNASQLVMARAHISKCETNAM